MLNTPKPVENWLTYEAIDAANAQLEARATARRMLRELFAMPSPRQTLLDIDLLDYDRPLVAFYLDPREVYPELVGLAESAHDQRLRESQEQAEDELVRVLHDHSTPQAIVLSRELAHELMVLHPPTAGASSLTDDRVARQLEDYVAVNPEVSFIKLCRHWGRHRLLDKLLAAGAPSLDDWGQVQPDRSLWALALTLAQRSPDADGVDGEPFPTTIQLAKKRAGSHHRLLLTALSPLTPSSARLMDMYLQYVLPVDRDLHGAVPDSSTKLNCQHPGSAHVAVLNRTLNGSVAMPALSARMCDLPASSHQATWESFGRPGPDSTHWQLGLELCQRLIAAGMPAMTQPNCPLDAGLFLLAVRGSSEDWELSVRPALELYIKAGLLDLDRPLSALYDGIASTQHPSVTRYIKGLHPLMAAIMLDNADAARALIELGCSTDPETVYRPGRAAPTHYRSLLPPRPNGTERKQSRPADCAEVSLTELALWHERPRTAAAIAAALMTKTARAASLAVGNQDGSADRLPGAETEECAETAVAVTGGPSRRRMRL